MPEDTPRVVVFAGTNGAGKSSVGGAALRQSNGDYFNPDEVARSLRTRDPRPSQRNANIRAWEIGKRLLEDAIANRRDHSFETTLGGRTITSLLERALDAGFEVHIWYVGLRSVQLHIDRVAARVARGGHDIPDADIRRRYDNSRKNLVRLLPRVTRLMLYDNSEDADPRTGKRPSPQLLLHLERGTIVAMADTSTMPEWAKPILAAAIQL